MVAESVGGCETEGESDMDVPEVALDAEDMKRRRNDMFLWRVFGRAVVVVVGGWLVVGSGQKAESQRRVSGTRLT